ncbi:uncharacterized protein [Amphiura filiformis]|uniref:uncharacterized protein n=1 Tax=Amphiura filiformis TaxID=82378 RepID=UPI003B224626
MNELHDSLTKLRATSNGQIFLAGDFNLPDIEWENNSFKTGGQYPSLSKKLLEITAEFGLEQVVREPTRGNNTLDLFFTTNPTLVEKSIVVPGISDHDSIPLIIVNCRPKINKQKARKIFLYHKADLQALKSDLKNWSDLFVRKNVSNSTVNELYSDFQCAIEDAMDTHIPSKMSTKRSQTPWINKKIKRLHKRKQRAFNAYKKSPNPSSHENFTEIRKTVFKETRNSYRRHIADVCSDSPKSFWSFIKSLKVDAMGIPTLKKDGKLESENVCKAEILNDQFRSVFTKEDNNPPKEQIPKIPTMPDITISPEGVAKLLKELDPKRPVAQMGSQRVSSNWMRRN